MMDIPRKIGWFAVEPMGIAVANPQAKATVFYPQCCICDNNKLTQLKEVNINVQDCTIGDTYTICVSCGRRTRRMLKKLGKMDPMELPIYINNSNIFIRNRASELLNK
jgi:hypothetical protein